MELYNSFRWIAQTPTIARYCNYSWGCLHMGASYLELGSPTPSAKSLEMLRFGRESGISSTWAHFLQGFWKTPAASCGIQNSNREWWEWWGPNFGLFETAFAIVDVKKSLGRMHTTCYGNILEYHNMNIITWQNKLRHDVFFCSTESPHSQAMPGHPRPRSGHPIVERLQILDRGTGGKRAMFYIEKYIEKGF